MAPGFAAIREAQVSRRAGGRTKHASAKKRAGVAAPQGARPTARRVRARAGKRSRDLTRAYSRTQFAAKLRRLADAVESGRPFTIAVAGETLRIPADATFNVEHERSGRDEELEFQLLWTTARR